jgi:hypothetical protein
VTSPDEAALNGSAWAEFRRPFRRSPSHVT